MSSSRSRRTRSSSSSRGSGGSSSSRSGRGSSRSRSRSRSKSSNPADDLKRKKKTNSPAANFVAMITGMICSLVVIAGAYSWATSEPEIEDRPDSGDAALVGPVESEAADFDDVLASATEEKITQMIRSIRNMDLAQRPLPVAMDMLGRQLRLSDRMLEISTDTRKRNFAIRAKLEAAEMMYGLDAVRGAEVMSIAETLREAALPYVDHEKFEIARSARLTMTKLHVFEFGKEMSAENLELASDSLCDVTRRYSDNSTSISTIRILLNRCMRQAPERFLPVLDRLVEESPDNPTVREMVDDMRDQALLHQAGYDQLIANYWANGEKGKQDLQETTLELLGQQGIGRILINRIDQTINWLEQNKEFDLALQIAEELGRVASGLDSQEGRRLAATYSENCTQRIALLEQPLDISGSYLRSGEVEEFNKQRQVKVLLFWDDSEQSLQALDAVLKIGQRRESANIAMVAVSTDNNTEIVDRYSALARRWWFMTEDPRRGLSNSLLEKYPVSSAPQIVVVDSNSVVMRINVPLDQLESVIAEAEFR
ncbi:MAG: hypothetical protein AAF456_04370 [Planctomycetota bacterium]